MNEIIETEVLSTSFEDNLNQELLRIIQYITKKGYSYPYKINHIDNGYLFYFPGMVIIYNESDTRFSVMKYSKSQSFTYDPLENNLDELQQIQDDELNNETTYCLNLK